MLCCGAISLSVLWFAVHVAQDSMDFHRRLHLVEIERSHGHLESAESMLCEVQAETEARGDMGFWFAAAVRERGLLRDDEGRPEEAIRLYEQALAIFRAMPNASPDAIGLTLANLASAHVDAGNADLGLSLSADAMVNLQSVPRPEFAIALYAHAHALHGLDRNMEALKDLREALAIWDHAAEPDYSQMALVKETMAACLGGLGYLAKAEASERESLAIRIKAFGPDSLGVSASLNNLGVLLIREQLFSEGEQSLQKAAFILEQIGESGHHRLVTVLRNLGTLYSNQASKSSAYYPMAEKIYRRELALEERAFGTADLRVSDTLERLGETLYHEHAYAEAGQVYGRGLALKQTALGPTHPKTILAARRYQVLAKKMKSAAR